MNTTQTTEPIKTNFVFRNIESYISDRMDLRYNTVKLCTEYRYRGEDEYQVLSDRENAGIYVDMKEDNLFKFTKSDYEMYMQSGRIEDFDPYVSYFENLPAWDGEDRIKKLASYVDVEEGDGYYFAVQLKKWLVRVVKCALENNYFNKQVFVFVGETQNTGKTTFCRWLCPPVLKDYYSEETLKGKDESIQLVSNFLILYDEMVKLNQTGVEEVKATLSKLKIKFRPPYARREQSFNRRCSFMGNTNQSQFLIDETGSARFLCFLLKKIDFAYSKELNIDDIYSQAYYLYKSGYICELTPRELEALTEYNKQFFVKTTEYDMITEYMRPATADDEKTTTVIYQWQAGQIVQFLTDNNPALKINAISAGKALKFLGFERKIIKKNNYPRYIYNIVLNHEAVVLRDILKYARKQKNN